MSAVIARMTGVSKKFCRSTRHGMAYSSADVIRRVIGLPRTARQLRRGEFWAVDQVSLDLPKGACLGLLGANGSGKSTLLKLLSGIFPPDIGSIEVSGRVCPLIEVGAGFHPALTGRENIYVNGAILGLDRRQVDQKLDAIIDFSGLEASALDAPVKTYSSGMHVRLGFAVAVHSEPDIMLVDEVLSVGDINFQRRCLSAVSSLQNRGTSFIVTSHSVDFISGWADAGLLLDHGCVLAQGNTSSVVQRYVELMAAREAEDLAAADGESRTQRQKRAVVAQDDAHPLTAIQAAEPLTLGLLICSPNGLRSAELDVRIYNTSGQLLSESYSSRSLPLLDFAPGTSRLAVSFPGSPVNRGTLRIEVSLWADGRSEMVDFLRIGPLPVVGDPRQPGELCWTPVYQVLPQTRAGLSVRAEERHSRC